MLTIVLVLLALVLGFYAGAENPSLLAKAKADLAKAQAESLAVETRIRKLMNPGV